LVVVAVGERRVRCRTTLTRTRRSRPRRWTWPEWERTPRRTQRCEAVQRERIRKRARLARTRSERGEKTMSRIAKTHATGRIDGKSYEPQPYEEVEQGPNLVEIHVTETFSGDIEGEGVVRFLQAIREDGSASFVGIERVSGSIAGRSGTFLLQDAG